MLGFGPTVVSCRWTSDQEAAAYGRYRGSVSQADLERFFFLDDADEALVARDARGDYNRLGYSVQLTTVRYVGRFLADPLEGVPTRSHRFFGRAARCRGCVVCEEVRAAVFGSTDLFWPHLPTRLPPPP